MKTIECAQSKTTDRFDDGTTVHQIDDQPKAAKEKSQERCYFPRLAKEGDSSCNGTDRWKPGSETTTSQASRELVKVRQDARGSVIEICRPR